MRRVCVLLHRWVGLGIAAFLIVAGLTGALIAWERELDGWLNPDLYAAPGPGAARPSPDLAALIEARDPRARVTRLPLAVAPGAALRAIVQPRADPATGRPHELDYDEVFLDPATGAELGRRRWGQAWPLTRRTLVPFLYRLHYSLHVPAVFGLDRLGTWFMGGVAVLWALDGFVGLYLTLPARGSGPAGAGRGRWARWGPAWRIKTSGSAYRITFDLHRAVSLWTWGALLALAFTAFALNLEREVFSPLVRAVATVTPSPAERIAPGHAPSDPALSYGQILERGRVEGARRGWAEPAGAMAYDQRRGVYAVRFFAPGEDHGPAGAGPATLFYDGRDGGYLGDRLPWSGTAADVFVRAQFPVHSGRILGLPGRVLVSLMGLAVAMLSATGVAIWWRKRAALASVRGRRPELAAVPDPVA